MSERERWIIYPLLFFALGAGIRDKILQRVEVKEIYCESLKIIDKQDPTKPLAELSFRRKDNRDPSQLADRVGHLRLIDSDGREVCDMTNDMFVDRLIARQMLVVDPSRRPLVLVGTEPVSGVVTQGGDQTVSYQGVIYLNNRPLGTGIRLAPPAARQPAPAARAEDSAKESTEKPSEEAP